MNYQPERISNYPFVSMYAVEFDMRIDEFVAFFGKFYRNVRPSDHKAFHLLLREMGKSPLESKFVLNILFNSQGNAPKRILDLFFAFKRPNNQNILAELVVGFILHKDIQRRIIDEALCLKSTNTGKAPWITKSKLADSFNCMNDVSIKATFLDSFMQRPPVDMPNDTKQRTEIYFCFFAALVNLKTESSFIAHFIQEIFELGDDRLICKKFAMIVKILRPEYHRPLENVAQYEDVYKINYFRVAAFRFIQLFMHDRPIETAKAILSRLDALYENQSAEENDEEINETENLTFIKEQYELSINDKYALESFNDLRTRLIQFIAKVQRNKL